MKPPWGEGTRRRDALSARRWSGVSFTPLHRVPSSSSHDHGHGDGEHERHEHQAELGGRADSATYNRRKRHDKPRSSSRVPSPLGGFIAEGRGGSEATGEGRLSRCTKLRRCPQEREAPWISVFRSRSQRNHSAMRSADRDYDHTFGFGSGISSRVGPNRPAGCPPACRFSRVSWPRW